MYLFLIPLQFLCITLSAHGNDCYRGHNIAVVWSSPGIAVDSSVAEDTLLHTEKSTYHTSEPIVIVGPTGGELSTREFVFAEELGGFACSLWKRGVKGWDHVISRACAGCRPEFKVLPARLQLKRIADPGEYKLLFLDRHRHSVSTAPFTVVP